LEAWVELKVLRRKAHGRVVCVRWAFGRFACAVFGGYVVRPSSEFWDPYHSRTGGPVLFPSCRSYRDNMLIVHSILRSLLLFDTISFSDLDRMDNLLKLHR
jgi:hypothetical protein